MFSAVLRRLAFWFLALVVVLALSLAVGVQSVATLIRNRHRVETGARRIDAVEDVLSSLRDAETGQRGYLITGRASYLEPYREALARIDGELDTLRMRLADEPVSPQQLRRLEVLIRAKLNELDETIRLRRDQGFEASQRVVLEDRGKRTMDEIRQVIAEIENENRKVLEQRARESATGERRVYLTLGVIGLIDVLLLGVIFHITRRALMEQGRVAEEIRQLNLGLEQRVVERTAELQHANQELTDMNQELEAFSYTVSHDLRAPLRTVQGFATALQEDFHDRLGEKGSDSIRRIVRASGRMETLIEDLLRYSRLSRSKLPRSRVLLRRSVDDALQLLSAEIASRRAEVQTEGEFPDVDAHPGTLVLVIENLISNAIKFVPAGRQPRVRLRGERRGENARLWVEDNGIGIKLEHQHFIFKVFERLHGAEAFPGTGIGLAIVAKGAERMGGRSGVESREGEGAKFWVELPCA